MCGIVGYLGQRDASKVLIEGLARLEYRGYDSAGVAVLNGEGLKLRRSVGRLKNLADSLKQTPLHGNMGIGHTRWATHGVPAEKNAHPHPSADGKIAVIHNGIVENYREIKAELMAAGVKFASDTDTECIAHLVAHYYKGDLLQAAHKAVCRLHGAWALVIAHADHPDLLVVARRGSPLLIGLGEGENFVASDVTPLLPYTRRVIYIDEGQLGTISRKEAHVYDAQLREVPVKVETTTLTLDAAEKGGFEHFMLKEIHEQPVAVEATVRGRVKDGRVDLSELNLDASRVKAMRRIQLIACGTSLYSAMVGKYLLERFTSLPTEAWSASEYRYANPIIDAQTLVVAISQSGETADTLEALRLAKSKGALAVSICNVMGSSIPRMCEGTLYTRAGPEIGVASTKAYTAQLTAFELLALGLGRMLGCDIAADEARLVAGLNALPAQIKKLLEGDIVAVKRCAKRYQGVANFMYIGRHYNFPTALEGALKLKEISYIHAEGYAAGEMKHGPIALVDPGFPSVVIATRNALRSKVISNIEQLQARGGAVAAIVTEGDDVVRHLAGDVLEIPECDPALEPILAAIALQRLAYRVAILRGCDVDQPRNLAKTVTVE